MSEEKASWEDELREKLVNWNKGELNGTLKIGHYHVLKDFIEQVISQEKEKIIQEINKLESENWQDTYEAGFEDAKEIIINLLQNK